MGNNYRYFGGGVDYVYRSLILFFLVFSTPSFADTYVAFHTYTSGNGTTNFTSTISMSDVCSKFPTVSGNAPYFRSSPIACAQYVVSMAGYNFYVIQDVKSCPAGGTVSGGDCINASACVAPQVRNAITKMCEAPPVSCTYTEYNDTPSTCAKIPDCNLVPSAWGNFFDVATKACLANPDHQLCVASPSVVRTYCSPIRDCISPGTICSNNADAVTISDNNRAIELSKSRQKVIDDMLAITAGVDYAKEQAAVKAAQLAADKAGMADAVTAYSNPQATQEQQAQAKLDYAEWVKRELEDKAKAANAWQAADAAAAAKARAKPPADLAPTSTMPGDVTSIQETTGREREIVIGGVQDSIRGDGNGTGPGTGTQAGLPSPTDNTISAIAGLKRSVDGVKGAVDGVKDAINNKKTDCQLTPNAAGCSILDSPGAPETLLTDEVGISSGHPSWGAGTCPSSVSVSHGVAFDYQPMCSQLVFFKPILIAVGLIISLFIVSGGVKD
jgi:hypothetical protein